MASSVPVAETAPPRYPRVAPLVHTLVLVAVMLLVSFNTAHSQQRLAHRSHLVTYSLTMAWEWAMLAYCWWGFRKAGVRMRDIIGGRWNSVEDFLLDLGIAAGAWIVFAMVLLGLAFLLGAAGKESIEASRKSLEFLVPRTGLETGLWLLLSATAGFCEEIVFRGYLQRQCASLARNAWGGIALSAVIFGFSHGYEGPKRMVMVAALGAMLGVLAHFRRSLRPSMIAHTWQDALAGLALRALR